MTAVPKDPAETLTLAPLDPADTDALRDWAATASTVFLKPRPTGPEVEARKDRFAGQRLTAGRDGAATVATFRSFDTSLSVPGGSVPANALSSVTVLPTHRRRGLLTRWMTGELRRATQDGATASVLIASEAPIYGRFGFGTAATACTWTLDARAARFLPPRAGSIEIVSPEVFAACAPAVYERARCRQPGAIDRSGLWWQTLSQVRPPADGPDRHRVLVLHRDAAGTVDGALAYKVVGSSTERVSSSRLEVIDLVAADDAAAADLWRYCCEVDFVTEVRAEDRSPTEPLPWLLADPRAARSGPVNDFLWARLHDVPAALSARRYPVPGTVVLDVADPLADVGGGRTCGRYRLEVAADGTACCTPTSHAADLHLAVDALAALWLGGAPAAVLHRAGRLQAADPGALARASALLSWPDPAWCGTWF
jgi:predicted acetyltransferase